MAEKLSKEFVLHRGELEEKLGVSLNHTLQGYDIVLPLRDLREIDHIAFFKQEALTALIRKIPLRNKAEGEVIYPYGEAKIEVYGVEPRGLAVGQTFVHQSKLLGIMQHLTGVFSLYVTKGISKMPPVQVYGKTASGEKSMSFY